MRQVRWHRLMLRKLNRERGIAVMKTYVIQRREIRIYGGTGYDRVGLGFMQNLNTLSESNVCELGRMVWSCDKLKEMNSDMFEIDVEAKEVEVTELEEGAEGYLCDESYWGREKFLRWLDWNRFVVKIDSEDINKTVAYRTSDKIIIEEGLKCECISKQILHFDERTGKFQKCETLED